MSDQTATISTPFPAPAKPAPASAAARTKLILEGPIFSTLLRMSAPNVLNLLAFAGMVTFDGFFLGRPEHPRDRHHWRERYCRHCHGSEGVPDGS